MLREGSYVRMLVAPNTRMGTVSRIFDTFDIAASMYHNGAVRTTVTLDRDVYEATRHLSRVSGRRLGKVLSELARRGLTREAPSPRKGKKRFPTFQVPLDAPVIPASRVQEVLDEEGYF